MSEDRKWASNDKDKLLVENFKNFMKEGDFSADDSLDLLAEEETPHEKANKYYKDAEDMQESDDPRVQFLGYLQQQSLDRAKKPKDQRDDAKETFGKALELWYKGSITSSKTLAAAERRLSREKSSWLGGKIQNFVKKSPLLFRMFRNREYKNMMKNFDNFMIYKNALAAVNWEEDKLPPKMKELEKTFDNDFVDRIVDDWRERQAEEAARERGKKNDPSTVDWEKENRGLPVRNKRLGTPAKNDGIPTDNFRAVLPSERN